MRLIREKERKHLTGVPVSTCYLLMSRGEFPKPVKLTGRAVAWVEDELLAWNAQRITEGRKTA